MNQSTLAKKPLLKRIFSDNTYCWLAFLCTAGLMLLVFYCFDLFPFGGSTILRMDLYHQYGPLFAEFYDRVTNLKSLIYSWNSGLGSPFLGNFFNYLSSPAAVIMLIAGHKNMPEAIAFMIFFKAAFSAASFTYYLKKSVGRHDYTSAAFGVLYSMCGYFVAYYWDVMWIDAMVYFPLVIYGIERIINRRKPSVYIAALAMTFICNYYMGYMTCIFSVLYFFVYFFSINDFTTLADNAVYTYDSEGNKQYSFREKVKGNVFLRSGFTFAAGSVAAACLVAFSLIPVFIILRSCSATSGSMPQNYRTYFSIYDFLANHLASVAPTIRSSGDDVLPNVYCGIATILLVPLYLFSKQINIKEKISNIFLLGIIFVSFDLNVLNYIWHGFHFPNDLPYRFSFMYSFILLVLAYKAFTRLNEFTGRQILGAGVAVIGFVIITQKIGSKNVEDITILLSIIFAVSYCLIFYLLKEPKRQKAAIAVVLLCCVVAEIACANTDRYSMSQVKTTFTGDYDDFRSIKSGLDKIEGNDDYRMELTYNRARMDPCWFGYNGISTFSSMAYEKMSNIQSDLGVYGNYINSYTYYMQTPVYNMMHSLKYIVNNDTNVVVDDDYYTQIASKGNFTAYSNKYWLPIGMPLSPDIIDWNSDYRNPFMVQADWFRIATGVDYVFDRMNISNISYNNIDPFDSAVTDNGEFNFKKTYPGGDSQIIFELSVDEAKHCYFFFDSSSVEEVGITRFGSTIYKDVDEPYIFDLGITNPGETVNISVNLDGDSDDSGLIYFYPYYVNDEALNTGYEALAANQFEVESFEDTRITGRVKTEEESVFFTSIPYDKGWQVKIDGKAISKDDYIALKDAYLCFNLPAGEHKIELKFKQRGLLEGACVSAFTAICLLLAALYVSRTREKRRVNYEAKCEQALTEYMETRKAAEEAARAESGEDLAEDFGLFRAENEKPEAGEDSLTEEAAAQPDPDVSPLEALAFEGVKFTEFEDILAQSGLDADIQADESAAPAQAGNPTDTQESVEEASPANEDYAQFIEEESFDAESAGRSDEDSGE